jgi:outer membrane protein
MASGFAAEVRARSAVRAVAVSLAAVLHVLAIAPALASAETIAEALVSAYRSNPRLEAERARLRATDEEIARARSGYRPTVTGTADAGVSRTETKPEARTDGTAHPHGYTVTAVQPVFRGFRTRNAVSEAEATVRAGQEQLRGIEITTLLDAATAYADVVRDDAIAMLRRDSVKTFSDQARAVKVRQSVGEATNADLAQAEARLARAISTAASADATARASRAFYRRVVGREPGKLARPNGGVGVARLLPKSEGEAVRIGESENPNAIAAFFLERAARHAAARIKGELFPEITLQGDYSRRFEPDAATDRRETMTAQLRLRQVILDNGEIYARARQAEQTRQSREADIRRAVDEIRSNIVQAHARLIAARSQRESNEAQVKANTVAVEGVRAEEKNGQRSILEVLNAEQELVDARVALVGTERDLVVAEYALVASIGRLTAADLRLKTLVYDPVVHADEVRHKWFGLTISHADGRRHNLQAVDPGRRSP